MEDEQTQKKVEALIAKIDADPYNPQNYYALGSLLTQLGSFEQAEELFKRALNVFESDPQKQALLHYGLGNVFYSTGLFKEAEQEYAYLKDSALQAEAMLMLAQSEEAVSNHQKALAYALTAYEKGQDDTVLAACSVMADAFLALGNFAQAKTYYDLYLKARPKDKRILFARGVVQLGLGLDGTAYFDKVKQIDEKYYLAKMSNLDDISQTLNHNKELESDS